MPLASQDQTIANALRIARQGSGRSKRAGGGATPARYLRPAVKVGKKIYVASSDAPVHDDAERRARRDDSKAVSAAHDDPGYLGYINHQGHYLTRARALDYAREHDLLNERGRKHDSGHMPGELPSEWLKPDAYGPSALPDRKTFAEGGAAPDDAKAYVKKYMDALARKRNARPIDTNPSGTTMHTLIDLPPIKRAKGGDLEKSHPDYGHTTHERSFDHEYSTDEPTAETKTHEGPIISSVSGRTDHLNMNVKSGSHVLPADVVAALGEGNTLSGLKVVRDLFAIPNVKMKGLPYNAQGLPYGVTTPSRAADGGKQDGDAPFNIPKSKSVPIIAAGGEHVITPDEVEYVAKRHGSDDRDDGHAIIDAFIKQVRKNHIKTLRKLPGPAKD